MEPKWATDGFTTLYVSVQEGRWKAIHVEGNGNAHEILITV